MSQVGFDSLLDELELLVEWGIAEKDAVRAATYHAAHALNRPDLGHVKANSSADPIWVERNPREDIKALRELRAVMRRVKFVHNGLSR
jgi:imidazolonepropionase-like amidohydrolase